MAENEIPEIDWTQAGGSDLIEPADFIDSEAEEDKYKKKEVEEEIRLECLYSISRGSLCL